jgi:archaellum component FlaC
MKYNFNTESIENKMNLLRRFNYKLNYYKKQKDDALKEIKKSSSAIKGLEKRIKEEKNLLQYELIQQELEQKQ